MALAVRTMPTTLPAEQARRRSHRVMMLLGLVFLLSLGDLYNTMTIARSIGMIELNPIARHLLTSDSAAGLVLYKLGTVGIAVGLLLKIRGHLLGEVGTWVMVAVMTGLTIYWHQYGIAMSGELTDASYHEMSSMMQALAAARPKP